MTIQHQNICPQKEGVESSHISSKVQTIIINQSCQVQLQKWFGSTLSLIHRILQAKSVNATWFCNLHALF
jgi:hypothetical protein